MLIKVMKNNKGYNGWCENCGKVQHNGNTQPLLVYWKENENKRGNYDCVCCLECAKEYSDYLKESFN